MTAQHTIRWTLNDWGVRGKITCTGTDDDPCHKACATCEESCNCGEPPTPIGHCNPLEWIDNDGAGIEELYDGPSNGSVHDGPVNFTWTGDAYTWHYAEDEAKIEWGYQYRTLRDGDLPTSAQLAQRERKAAA